MFKSNLTYKILFSIILVCLPLMMLGSLNSLGQAITTIFLSIILISRIAIMFLDRTEKGIKTLNNILDIVIFIVVAIYFVVLKEINLPLSIVAIIFNTSYLILNLLFQFDNKVLQVFDYFYEFLLVVFIFLLTLGSIQTFGVIIVMIGTIFGVALQLYDLFMDKLKKKYRRHTAKKKMK